MRASGEKGRDEMAIVIRESPEIHDMEKIHLQGGSNSRLPSERMNSIGRMISENSARWIIRYTTIGHGKRLRTQTACAAPNSSFRLLQVACCYIFRNDADWT